MPFDLLGLIPDDLKQRAIDTIVTTAADKSEGVLGERFSKTIRRLHSDAEFRVRFEQALKSATNRFVRQSTEADAALIMDAAASKKLFESPAVQNALVAILKQPNLHLEQEHESLLGHLEAELSSQYARADVERVVNNFLIVLAEEIWSMEEFSAAYALMFQKAAAEAAYEQVRVSKAQLEATIGLRSDLKQLSDTVGQKGLTQGEASVAKNLGGRLITAPGEEAVTPTSTPQIQDLQISYDTYKNNLIADILNNLVLELYDKVQYEDICITPLIYRAVRGEDSQPFEAIRLTQENRSAILGDPGSGKTTTLRKICLDLFNQTPVAMVPVYISLASFDSDYTQGKVDGFADYIEEEIALHGCPSLLVLANSANAEPVLLLDGWDELVSESAVREAKRYLATTQYKFVITSRPEAQRSLPFVERYEMYPLSRDRMEEFVRLRIKEPRIVQSMMRWLIRHPAMLRLAENPLNLSIMTIVFTEDEGNVGHLTRTKLYERALYAIIRQHHREHSYDESLIFEIELILQNLAYQTMSTGSGRFFSMRELNKASQDALNRIASRELTTLLVGKLGIVRDRRSGRMEFFHLWYQEFLAGRYIVETSPSPAKVLSQQEMLRALPYVIGLMEQKNDAFELMQEVEIGDPFNYCRAIPEGQFTSKQAENLILRVLQFGENHAPKIPVRIEMARALAQTGLSSIQCLFNIMEDSGNSDYARRAALEALVLLPVNEDRFRQSLVELLKVQSLGLLWHVIEQAGKRRIRDATSQLEELTQHTDPIVVGDSIWALGEIDASSQTGLTPHQIDAVLECLASEDRHVQGHALRTLGRLKVRDAIPKLKKHLEEPTTGYRWIVPEAAQLIGGKESVEVIDLALIDRDPRVVAAGLKAISEINADIGEQTVERIEQHVDNPIWIPFLEQSLGNIARSTIRGMAERKKRGLAARVFIARHCRTQWNIEHRLQGTIDLPLSPEGRADALELVPHIERLGVERLVASPYRRARETAEIYANHLGIPLHIHPGFRELDHGQWEGKSIEELLEFTEYPQWLSDPTGVSIPGSSESITTAQQRALEAMKDVSLRYGGSTILVVTHKHIRALLECGLQNVSLSNFESRIDESRSPREIPPEQILRLIEP